MFKRFAMLAVALLGVAACGTSDGSAVPMVYPAFDVPAAVIDRARVVALAARGGDPEQVASLAATGFEFDFTRPDVTFVEHLQLAESRDLLNRLGSVLESTPTRRLSPIGNGTVQELWIYPGLALDLASDWTPAEIEEAVSAGLFSAKELAEYQEAGAYLGFSVGFSPEGDWVFFTSGRVARTPR